MKKTRTALALSLVALTGIAGCSMGGFMSPAGKSATARLMTPAGAPGGTARLVETSAGVEISISVEGLKPGLHGFHVHENGVCAPGPDAATGQTVPFGAAGPHYDPGQSRKHGRPGAQAHEAHGGDMPNISVGADGKGTLKYMNTNVTLSPGPRSAMNRALVVHNDPDDYATNPSGNSGGRALCGVIQ
jgi:Cu-Zn family superoxide dismutase